MCSVAVDRVRLRGQHGVHLEPADQGDRAEAPGPHRYSTHTFLELDSRHLICEPLLSTPSISCLLLRRRHIDRLPPDREHHRVRGFRKRQNHQAMEKRLLSSFWGRSYSFFFLFCCKKGLFSKGELLRDAEGFHVMKFSKENQMRHSIIGKKTPHIFCSGRVPLVTSEIFPCQRASFLLPPQGLFFSRLLLSNADALFWCSSIIDTALTPDVPGFIPTTHICSCTINVVLIWPFYDLFCLLFFTLSV